MKHRSRALRPPEQPHRSRRQRVLAIAAIGLIVGMTGAVCEAQGAAASQQTLPEVQAELSEAEIRQRMTQLIDAGGSTFETRHRSKDGTERLVVVKNDLRIVEAVIGLAHAFDREVVAEGVETEAHGELLLRMGCALAQGYGIARPMSRDRVLPWLRDYSQPAAWSAVSGHIWLQEDMPLVTMEVEHKNWVQAVIAQAQGDETIAPVALDASECHFGRWYALGGRRRYGQRLAFRRLRPRHEHVHELASSLIEGHAQGEQVDAAALEQLTKASDVLIAQIGKLQIELALSAKGDGQAPEPVTVQIEQRDAENG